MQLALRLQACVQMYFVSCCCPAVLPWWAPCAAGETDLPTRLRLLCAGDYGWVWLHSPTRPPKPRGCTSGSMPGFHWLSIAKSATLVGVAEPLVIVRNKHFDSPWLARSCAHARACARIHTHTQRELPPTDPTFPSRAIDDLNLKPYIFAIARVCTWRW